MLFGHKITRNLGSLTNRRYSNHIVRYYYDRLYLIYKTDPLLINQSVWGGNDSSNHLQISIL